MKKIMFALMGMMMISSTSVFAQLSYGVKAGLNLATQSRKIDDEKVDDIKFKPGFNIGAFADYSLSDLLSVEAGLNIETKGYKSEETETPYGQSITTNTKCILTYVTIPVDLRLSFGNFYVLAGPYLGLAATGKVKEEIETINLHSKKDNTETENNTTKLKFGSANDDDDEYEELYMKRMDFGIGLGAGYEITNNIGVRLGYDLGLSNITSDEDCKVKNGSINLSATFKF